MTVSIFNDVIGPVMRGPSSSHCAAALRIGRLARQLMENQIQSVLVQFDRSGSLPTTHTGQGSDMGLFGGLLGWEADDARLPEARKYLDEAGIQLEFEYGDYGDKHPNTYRLTLVNESSEHQLICISTGGGMIEVIQLDGFPVTTDGGYFETLVAFDTAGAAGDDWTSKFDEALKKQTSGGSISATCFLHCKPDSTEVMLQIQTETELRNHMQDADVMQLLCSVLGEQGTPMIVEPLGLSRLAPVLPVQSFHQMAPSFEHFLTCAGLDQVDPDGSKSLSEIAIEFEAQRSRLAPEEVVEKMIGLVRVWKTSLAEGLAGTEYEDRVVGCQSKGFQDAQSAGILLDGGIVNRIVLYTTALMEVKSSMGVIIAAPTAGACAALPATCLAVGEAMGKSDEEIAHGILAAGMVGVFIAEAWSFAAEVGGCQAEGGSASSMAAAALINYCGGTRHQACAAASMALQNMLGLICDPIANRVEVPCLGKNVMAASNAFCCANMVLSGFDAIIPLDETIGAARSVSERMPREHRCTGLGGLAMTPTSLKLLEQMEPQAKGCGSCQC